MVSQHRGQFGGLVETYANGLASACRGCSRQDTSPLVRALPLGIQAGEPGASAGRRTVGGRVYQSLEGAAKALMRPGEAIKALIKRLQPRVI
jgi:hypothetical protein